jgi:hypothetical protein
MLVVRDEVGNMTSVVKTEVRADELGAPSSD